MDTSNVGRTDEVREYKQILDMLETQHMKDLSSHLYSVVLQHALHPQHPFRSWTRWPLPLDRVPDPQTDSLYTDVDLKQVKFTPDLKSREIDDAFGIERFVRNAGLLKRGDKLKAKKRDDKFEGKREIEDNQIDDSSDSEFDTGEEVSDNDSATAESDLSDEELIVESANKSVDLELEDELLDLIGSDIDASDSESIKKPTSLRVIDPPSDYKVDLFLEMKALLERKVNEKSQHILAKVNEHLSSESPSYMTDDLVKRLCQKTDKLFQELSKAAPSKGALHNNQIRALNWQDVLIASQRVGGSDFNKEKEMEFYRKSDQVFHHANHAYEYNDIDVDQSKPFEYQDYLQVLEDHKYSKRKGLPKAKILEQKRQVQLNHDYKEKLFISELECRQRDIDLSVNKGLLKQQTKVVAPSNREDIPEFATRFGGLRIQERDFIVQFK